MIRITYRILGNYALSEDIVQNVFLILLSKQVDINNYEKPSAWLYKTLRNLIGNEIKSRKRKQIVSLSEIPELLSDDCYFKLLSDLLPLGLAENEREILIMHYEVSLSHREIAFYHNITECAARARLSRAKKHCKELLIKDLV